MEAAVADRKMLNIKREHLLNAQTHGPLDGLAVSDQVGSILVLLPQQILTFLPADGAVVAHRQSCCHGEGRLQQPDIHHNKHVLPLSVFSAKPHVQEQQLCVTMSFSPDVSLMVDLSFNPCCLVGFA